MPAAAVKGIATGLVMMAVFTLIWAGIAYRGLAASNYWFALLVFPLFSVLFIVNAARLYKVARYYPKLLLTWGTLNWLSRFWHWWSGCIFIRWQRYLNARLIIIWQHGAPL